MSPGLDPSRSDQTFTEIHLKAKGIINPDLSPSDPGETAADTLTRIRHMLTQPRRPLYYDLDSAPGATGSSPILNLPTGRDDAGGVMPEVFDISYTTPTTLEVSWGCVVKIVDCRDGEAYKRPLSLRWEDTIEFDRTWKATYRRVGHLIVSSLDPVAVDQMRRTIVAPTIAPGFARESAHYTLSKDGLRCDFVFVDGQIRWSPPYPCVDLDIVQQETSPNLGGMRKGDIHVHVRGVVNANPADLYYWAVTAGMTRLVASHPLGVATGKIPGSTIFRTKESKDGVDAEFSLSYKVPPSRATAGVGVIARGLAAARVRTTPIGWLGYGTTPASTTNTYAGPGPAAGYAPFATPGVPLIPGKADGSLTAPSIGLFAALLGDPCGSPVPVQPYASRSVP